MAEESRTINSLKNVAMNISSQFLLLGLRFLGRTLFIHYLSVEYLGLDGLFSNVLSMLSLADLGITSALNYALYKPIRENDQERIKQLMDFFKKVYLIIAAFVLIMGLALVPFLHLIVNLDNAVPHVRLYYVLMLLSVVMTYLFVYKSALIIASQKEYLVTRITLFTQFLKLLVQIGVLVLWQNFALYLVVQIVIELIDNLIVSRTADKLYPYLKHNDATLEKGERKGILENIKSIFIYRFGGIIMNNTTDIFISVIVGTIYVGYYSNYLLIVNSISSMFNLLFSSLSASIGNKNADSDREGQQNIFNLIFFADQWLVSFCSISFFVLLSPFIRLWLGDKFVMSNFIVFTIALQFFVTGIMSATTMYRNTTGIFKETKYAFLATACLNLILGFTLGKLWGIAGILLAASLARLLTTFWFEPKVLFEKYFKHSSLPFFQAIFKYTMVSLLEGGVIIGLSYLIGVAGISGFIIQIILCLVIVNGGNLLIYRRNPEFRQLLDYLDFLKGFINSKRGLMKRGEEKP